MMVKHVCVGDNDNVIEITINLESNEIRICFLVLASYSVDFRRQSNHECY